MKIRQQTVCSFEPEIAESLDFYLWLTEKFDSIYEIDTQVTIKKIKYAKGGAEKTWDARVIPVLDIGPGSLSRDFHQGFYERESNRWWGSQKLHKGFLGVFCLFIHEYSHILFYWKYQFHKKNWGPHSRPFYDICRHLWRLFSFQDLWQEYKSSQLIEL